VDLRGHGRSDKPTQDYTVEGFAGDLAWLCECLEIKRPIVVGHSLGGVIAFELAALQPNLPRAIVALDSPLVVPPRLLHALGRVAESFHGPDYGAKARSFVENMFLSTDDHELRKRIVQAMTAGPRHVAMAAFEGMLASRAAAAATAPEIAVPLLALASAGGHMPDLARLRELCSKLVTGQTVGAGHFLQLEVPDQVNAMIERFTRLI